MAIDVMHTRDVAQGIFQRVTTLDPRASGILGTLFPPCDLEPIYHAASHQLTRASVKANPVGAAIPGKDNSMAWFPPDEGPFGVETISGLLTEDGELNPNSHVLGQIQIHRNVVIYLSWYGDGIHDSELYIEWDHSLCTGHDIYGRDQHGLQWEIHLGTWYAGSAPTWPDWLLPGA